MDEEEPIHDDEQMEDEGDSAQTGQIWIVPLLIVPCC